jgi:rhodanese-related sulfurtransferase
MPTSVKQLMEKANAVVPKITPAQAREMIAKGNAMRRSWRKAAKLSARCITLAGMLEFRADPDSSFHDKNFARDKIVILYCASGGRAALAGKVLKDMGYNHVYNMGAFKDWVDNGGAVEKPIDMGMS